jgi:DNA-binding response OmpR family regulator
LKVSTLFSGNENPETKRKALEGGAEALFTKPINFGTLRGEIDVRLERAA